ncbi:MAG: hypothetical protein SGJ18_03640 [Pseudomonadota bacterium]|nr:hypothetical protein [Pseudomonadota bacterium]
MNVILVMSVFLFGFLSESIYADNVGNKIEVSIEKVYVSPTGYDDNDNVQLIIDGMFPNQCYQIANTNFSIDEDKKSISIRQLARLKGTTDCQMNPLPEYLSYATRFSSEINLGYLMAGEYTVNYKSPSAQKMERKFKVEAAKSDSTDEAIYAPVSDAFIPEMIYETANAEIILTGVLESLCLQWKQVDIERFDDIIVVMPKMQLISTPAQCRQNPEPLEKIVSLGAVKEGRFLLHVRSMSGKGINRMFSVVKKPGDMSGK